MALAKNIKCTNADRIRSMSDKDLAEFMSVYADSRCPEGVSCSIYGCEFCWYEWLKREADDEDNT